MPLQLCADLSPADWIADSEVPWGRLVCLGPPGFEAYARLRFIPDPDHPGQSENDVQTRPEGPSEHARLHAALEVLRDHTTTPEEVYYCVWDGWGWSPSAADLAPDRQGRVDVFGEDRLPIPYRSYYLLRGTLADFGSWALAGAAPRRPGQELPDPAFVWPADRAWCVAHDVDPHYAGIGGTQAAVAALLGQPGLDVVRDDPSAEQPAYR
ncbi:hypothetical protein [Nocardioides panaciterrulae]|uniref:Uncharacterized protein n=1 Tax=Nocardioides panaciterrulae TaxID=661492 RepID=A0A7Y9E3L3_9ACTN|nr:hypothetical protein [Nocardioides panaciterrulae]NYD40608.1 hypothetical protein [Nocardioides panaciterrulae]